MKLAAAPTAMPIRATDTHTDCGASTVDGPAAMQYQIRKRIMAFDAGTSGQWRRRGRNRKMLDDGAHRHRRATAASGEKPCWYCGPPAGLMTPVVTQLVDADDEGAQPQPLVFSKFLPGVQPPLSSLLPPGSTPAHRPRGSRCQDTCRTWGCCGQEPGR